MSPRVLVLGASGIVGRATAAEAQRRGWPCAARDRAEADLTDRAAVERALAESTPDLVVNAAAYTRVDDCEREPELAHRVNGAAVAELAEATRRAGARLVQLSSDYVFDGEAVTPYPEVAPTGPRSVYGASKLAGEHAALAVPGSLVVRTSWVFGAGGPNFVDTMRKKMVAGEGPLSVVDDQLGAPTYAGFLARALLDLGESGASGIVHYQNRPAVTWYEFAREIARRLGSAVEIRPAATADVPRPARRPAYSVLSVERFERLVERRVEAWGDGLAEHLARS